MSLISFFSMIIMTSMTGTIAFLLWKIASVCLQKKGSIKSIKMCLTVVIIFFAVPVVFLYFACEMGLFTDSISGNLFQRTPFLQKLFVVIAVIWTAGFLWSSVRYYTMCRKLRQIIKHASRAENSIQKAAGEIEKRLKIKKIPVYIIPGQTVPAITGVWKCKILLPEKKYGKDELNIILEHELWHFKQGDLFLKKICGWIARIQWFNPLTRLLFRELDKWGDILCDMRLCHGEARWGKKIYFYTVFNNSYGQTLDSVSGMNLRKSLKEIEERAMRMSKYNPKKELKKAGLVLVAVCFAAVSAVTAMAAGNGLESVYNAVYDKTERIILEDTQPQIVSGEYEWLPDGSFLVIDSGEELNLNARGLTTYNWSIPANALKRTDSVYLSKGTSVTISIVSEPSSAQTGIGLDQPNGYFRGISGTGTYAHTFTVNQTGYHKIYARNETGSAIDAVVTVLIE